MNKAELGNILAERLGIPKKSGEIAVELFEEIITETLIKGEEVTIAGFGTFSARNRAGRKGVNPQNPSEIIDIPSVVVPKFKAGKALKDSLKGKRTVGASSTTTNTPAAPATPINDQPSV